MKMYQKNELEYKNGYVVKDGEIIGIDNELVDLMNEIELNYQRACYLKDQPKAVTPDLDLENFDRQSEFDQPCVVTDTPLLDKKIAETLHLMDEIDDIEAAHAANDWLQSVMPAIRFTQEDFVVSCNQDMQHRFDLPTLGNPLEWDSDTIQTVIEALFTAA